MYYVYIYIYIYLYIFVFMYTISISSCIYIYIYIYVVLYSLFNMFRFLLCQYTRRFDETVKRAACVLPKSWRARLGSVWISKPSRLTVSSNRLV